MTPCANEVVAAVRTARAAMRKRGIVVLREIWMCRTAGNCLDQRCDQRERPSAAPLVRHDLYRRDATIRSLQSLQSAQVFTTRCRRSSRDGSKAEKFGMVQILGFSGN